MERYYDMFKPVKKKVNDNGMNKQSPAKIKEEEMGKGKAINWRPLKQITVSNYEAWLRDMNYDPYLHDPELQSLDWVRNLTRAIKRVQPLVGEGREIEYKYWEALASWEFILNCLSIARATGTFALPDKEAGWSNTIEKFSSWVNGIIKEKRFLVFFSSGTDFFWDMLQFFLNGRELLDPGKLAQKVLRGKV
jgi:hypothetical protein